MKLWMVLSKVSIGNIITEEEVRQGDISGKCQMT